MVMPRSRSRSLESMTRSVTASLARKVPDWRSMASTRVVLPWSTCGMMAMLRIAWAVLVLLTEEGFPIWTGSIGAGVVCGINPRKARHFQFTAPGRRLAVKTYFGWMRQNSASRIARPQPQKGPSRSPGLLCFQRELPGTAAARCRHHGLTDVAAEGLAELVEVLHGALDAPLAGGVRVGLRLVDGSLRRHRAAPDLREAEEEPLVRGVAVALAVDVTRLGLRRALVGNGLHQRLVGDADACVVGGVLAQR